MKPLHIVVMGVSGCGKTTLAHALRDHFNCPFAEGDDLHTQANRDKMGAGIPLTDEDRMPWLHILRDWFAEHSHNAPISIVTCSALKYSYRNILRQAGGDVVFLHLNPPADINRQRMENRQGHYMKAGMLDSQLATLQPLHSDECGLIINNIGNPDAVFAEALDWLCKQNFEAMK